MCLRLEYKENRHRRNQFLILRLSSDEGMPGALGGWNPMKGHAGAQRELLRVGGPLGRTPGWDREASGEGFVRRKVSWEGKQ